MPRPTVNSTETISKMEDPFVVLESTSTHVVLSPGVFTDPLGEINKLSSSGGKKVGGSSAANGKMIGDDPLSSLGKSVAAFSSEMNKRGKDMSPLRTGPSTGEINTNCILQNKKYFVKIPENHTQEDG